jgi:hypothetical protein
MDLAERASQEAESLSRHLLPLSFTDRPSTWVTDELTRWVVGWGVDNGWRVRREVLSIAGLSMTRPDRSGYLDVVCERHGHPPIVIEIDRSNKTWSTHKLLGEAQAGAIALWVRWSGVHPPTLPPTIGVVRVPTTVRRIDGQRMHSRVAPTPDSCQ